MDYNKLATSITGIEELTRQHGYLSFYKDYTKADWKTRLKFAYLIYHDEFGWFTLDRKTRKKLTKVENVTDDVEELTSRVISFWEDWNSRNWLYQKYSVEPRQERLAKLTSARYKRFKVEARKCLLPFKYCTKCHTTDNLQIDHILSQFDFENESYSLSNIAYLCFECNSLKTNDSEDYRPDDLKQHIRDYIAKTGIDVVQ